VFFDMDHTLLEGPFLLNNISELWNIACEKGLEISERLVRYHLSAAANTEVGCRLAEWKGQPAGFVTVCATTGPNEGLAHPSGWIGGLAVTPAAQRQGIGSRLLSWAEAWLAQRGCLTVRLGGDPKPLVPGVPLQTGSSGFFLKRGYTSRRGSPRVWDVARSLDGYTIPAFVKALPLEVSLLQAGDVPEMDAFLRREFPGRWHFEFQEHLRLGGRASDYLASWGQDGIDGFCRITLEDGIIPIERFYPHGLPRPWGHLGPIGLSAGRRGQGMGSALLDAGLRYLHSRGVAGCVIDWTDLPDFYGKFGFQPHHEYLVLIKELN